MFKSELTVKPDPLGVCGGDRPLVLLLLLRCSYSTYNWSLTASAVRRMDDDCLLNRWIDGQQSRRAPVVRRDESCLISRVCSVRTHPVGLPCLLWEHTAHPTYLVGVHVHDVRHRSTLHQLPAVTGADTSGLVWIPDHHHER